MISQGISHSVVDKKILDEKDRKVKPELSQPIPFGTMGTDHMLICDYLEDQGGWQTPSIAPVQNFSLSPDAVVFHYGQTIFEGMKAFRGKQDPDSIFIFRPDMNAKRMGRSAQRLSMPPFPEPLFLQCVRELVAVEKDWVFPSPCALYIRPAMIPLDRGVSYRASRDYRFFIILSVAKDYFQSPKGLGVFIERNLSRAALGGCGEAKCGGNYAAALLPMLQAKQMGAEQVLWLDAKSHQYVEEAGAMNVMFVEGNTIFTPELSGSILHGVTRDSILKLAQDLGFQAQERKVEINSLIADIKSKKVSEMFACGTAAMVTPIGTLFDGQEKILIGEGGSGVVSQKVKQGLLDVQTGAREDKYNWLFRV